MSGGVASTTSSSRAVEEARRGCRRGSAGRRTAVLLAALVLALFLVAPTCAAPHRQTRSSDHKVAELKTEGTIRGVVVPVGLGKIDFERIGRRRRSEDNEQPHQMIVEPVGIERAGDDGGDEDEGEEERAIVEPEGARNILPQFLAAFQLQRPTHLHPNIPHFGQQTR